MSDKCGLGQVPINVAGWVDGMPATTVTDPVNV